MSVVDESQSGQGSRSFRRIFYAQRGSVIALSVLGVLVLLCIFVPLLPFEGSSTNLGLRWLAPSGQHWLGTDELGRDYLIRVFEGGRISLLVGFAATALSMTIGVIVGLASGYFGGRVDGVLMRGTDFLSSVPWMVLVIVASVFFKPGLVTIILIIGFLSWVPTARLIRAETLSARERTFVGYAKFIGENQLRIIGRHILFAVIPVVVVAATSTLSSAMLTESALSFLGLGVQQPLASWGSLLNTAQSSLQRAPLLAVIPGFLLALTVFCANIVGNGLRTALTRENEL